MENIDSDRMRNSLVWGIVEGKDDNKAIKICLETFNKIFDLPQNISLWDFNTDSLSMELRKLFLKHRIVLGETPQISNAFEENFVLVDDETYYIQDRKFVYRKKDFEFYLTDFEPILSLHKCIEDYILVRQQQDKRSIEDSVKLIGNDITHFGKKLNEVREKNVSMEEAVLDLCVDEMGMTRNQALKTLALVMASLLEEHAEFEKRNNDCVYIQ